MLPESPFDLLSLKSYVSDPVDTICFNSQTNKKSILRLMIL